MVDTSTTAGLCNQNTARRNPVRTYNSTFTRRIKWRNLDDNGAKWGASSRRGRIGGDASGGRRASGGMMRGVNPVATVAP